jgi:hypothetical protein
MPDPAKLCGRGPPHPFSTRSCSISPQHRPTRHGNHTRHRYPYSPPQCGSYARHLLLHAMHPPDFPPFCCDKLIPHDMLAYTNVSRRGASARAQHGSARVQVCNCRMPGRVQRMACAGAGSPSVAAWVWHHANTNDIGPVHLAYNPSYSACFFSRNSIFLSQKISQPCFSVGL